MIIERALAYIASTRNATTAAGRLIFAETVEQTRGLGFSDEALYERLGNQSTHGSCTIDKLADTPHAIHYAADAPGRWMFEGDVLAEACRMLQDALTEKKMKLADTPEPKILVLLHQWPMEGAWIYKGCASALNFLDYFHSIFVVETQDEGYFLHTEDPRWRACP